MRASTVFAAVVLATGAGAPSAAFGQDAATGPADAAAASLTAAADGPATADGPITPDRPATADAPAADHRAQIERMLDDLEADQYEVRDRAARKIEEWLAERRATADLAAALGRRWLSPHTSLEARLQLRRWLDRLPSPASTAADPPFGLPGADELVAGLEADSFSARAAASAQFRLLVEHPTAVGPLLLALKRRLADPQLADTNRRSLEPYYDAVRGAWLQLSEEESPLPAVDDAQLAAWVEALAAPGPATTRHEIAARELADRLACAADIARVVAALEARQAAGPLDNAAQLRFENLLAWTAPAMVAEYWEGERHLGIQHLLVDVPSVPEGAERPSHFDYIDEHVARCVSGNSLSPGEWPAGVAFPHPKKVGAMFHLVNLPTPRRRMAYEYDVERAEAQRLGELSRRTLARWLERGQPLTDDELQIAVFFDPEALGQFAGPFLLAVDDTAERQEAGATLGSASAHRRLCFLLARRATHDAVPGILAAIEAKRFHPPPADARYEWPWIAALSIARRDPWPASPGRPACDEWLAELIERREALWHGQAARAAAGATAAGDAAAGDAAAGAGAAGDVASRAAAGTDIERRAGTAPVVDEGAALRRPSEQPGASAPPSRAGSVPELGATAAAALLELHGASPELFGLETTPHGPIEAAGLTAYRFYRESGRDEVLAWWRRLHRPGHDPAAATGPAQPSGAVSYNRSTVADSSAAREPASHAAR